MNPLLSEQRLQNAEEVLDAVDVELTQTPGESGVQEHLDGAQRSIQPSLSGSPTRRAGSPASDSSQEALHRGTD